jgi:hypothetical protein
MSNPRSRSKAHPQDDEFSLEPKDDRVYGSGSATSVAARRLAQEMNDLNKKPIEGLFSFLSCSVLCPSSFTPAVTPYFFRYLCWIERRFESVRVEHLSDWPA